MSAYSILAKYYDRLMGDFDYRGYTEFIRDKLGREGVDLACGSGEMTIALAKLGHKMTGIDLSGEMLNVATLKAKSAGVDVRWARPDISQLELAHKVDFIVCVCDGVNYLSYSQLPSFFSKVKSYLKSGGVFIFDISSEYKLTRIIGDNLFCEDYDDVTYVWSNQLGDGYVDMELDFFERLEGDIYKRVEESHRQYIHTRDQLVGLLEKDWTTQIVDGETFRDADVESKRLVFVCNLA